MIELVIELLFELVVEGVIGVATEGMEAKKTPMPVRILIAVVLLLLLAGLTWLLLWCSMESDNIVVWVLLMSILAGLYAGLLWKIYKVFKKKKYQE